MGRRAFQKNSGLHPICFSVFLRELLQCGNTVAVTYAALLVSPQIFIRLFYPFVQLFDTFSNVRSNSFLVKTLLCIIGWHTTKRAHGLRALRENLFATRAFNKRDATKVSVSASKSLALVNRLVIGMLQVVCPLRV